jgi:tetratricopeptide (TPR) repeat protein
VDRAIRRLEAADLVERLPAGYVTTPTGQVAAARYRAYLRDQQTIDDAQRVLSVLPADTTVPPELVVGGESHPAGETPHRTFERLARHLRTAHEYRAAIPRIADSRHLRLLHARVVEDDLDAELLVAHSLAERLRREFPGLVADLLTSESCTLRTADIPPYGLALTDGPADPTVLLTTYGGGTLAGVVENDSAEAVEEAREAVSSVAESAEEVAPPASPGADGTSLSVGGSTRRALEELGIVRLDHDYFTERTPGDPETSWRVGFDPVDVYYGYAAERADPTLAADRSGAEGSPPNGDGGTRSHGTDDDDAQDGTPDDGGRREQPTSGPASPGPSESETGGPTVSMVLADELAAGDDHLVLGPAGAGKSTICRQVACRWVEAGRGPVYYRETATAGGDDLSGLADVATATDGHALVVVEDIAGPVTESFLRFVRAIRDSPSVSVLGEARRHDWNGAIDEVTDPQLREHAREGFSTYRPPTVDEETCRAAIGAFEAATGRSVPLAPGELLGRVENEGGIGEMYVLSYQVAAHTVSAPWLDDPVGPSVLDGDVRDVYRMLAPAGDEEGIDDSTLPLEVGLLVATLTAVEHPVTPGIVHALAVDRTGPDEDPASRAHRRVEAIIGDLDGRMFVTSDDATAYRTQHPQWATRFLREAIEASERETVALFERALNAVLALADDATRRRRIEEWLGRDSSTVRRFADPDTVDEFVETVFGLGLRRSMFAPLFGTTDHSGIELPDGCSTGAKLEAASCRGNMWYDHGSLDRAESELSALVDRAEEADEAARTLYLAEGYWALGELVVDRGETAQAREYLSRSRKAASRGGHSQREAGALNSLAWVAMTVDEYDRAESRLEESLAIVEELGVCGAHSDTLYYLARLARLRGDLAAAADWLDRTVEMDRQLGYRGSLSASIQMLGDVTKERGNLDEAEDHYRRSLELKREVRDRQGTATVLYEFGDLQLRREEPDAARESFRRSLEIATDNDMRRVEGRARCGLGRVALRRGDLDEADRRLRNGRGILDDVDHKRGVANGTASLAALARKRGDLDPARQRYAESYEQYRDIDATSEAVETLDTLIDVCLEAGDVSEALAWCERARTYAEDADLDDWVETFENRLETVHQRASE